VACCALRPEHRRPPPQRRRRIGVGVERDSNGIRQIRAEVSLQCVELGLRHECLDSILHAPQPVDSSIAHGRGQQGCHAARFLEKQPSLGELVESNDLAVEDPFAVLGDRNGRDVGNPSGSGDRVVLCRHAPSNESGGENGKYGYGRMQMGFPGEG
jgi:hypothetical protein